MLVPVSFTSFPIYLNKTISLLYILVAIEKVNKIFVCLPLAKVATL